jgi:hypothetical protein
MTLVKKKHISCMYEVVRMHQNFGSLAVLLAGLLIIGLASLLVLFSAGNAYAGYDQTRNSLIQFNPFSESPFRSKEAAGGVMVLVTVEGVQGKCGISAIISVAYQTQNHILCEQDKRPLDVQQKDPMLSEEFEFHFAKDEIKQGDSFDACIRIETGFSNCKTLTNKSESQAQKVGFTLPLLS